MADQQYSTTTPTEKMLNLAERIAKSLGRALPDSARETFEGCRDFIDANKESLNKPTEKQLELAKKLAAEKNVTISNEQLSDRFKLSAFIDEHLGKKK